MSIGSPPDSPAAMDTATTDWYRVRAGIEHEDSLINHRLTWLFTSQAFLFTAFVFVFLASMKDEPKNDYRTLFLLFLLVLGIVGATISFWIHTKLYAAEVQLTKLREWWFFHHQPEGLNDTNWKTRLHPPIMGIPFSRVDRMLVSSRLPVVFLLAWFLLLGIVIWIWQGARLEPYVEQIAMATLFIVTGLVLVGGGFVWGRKRASMTANSSNTPGAS